MLGHRGVCRKALCEQWQAVLKNVHALRHVQWDGRRMLAASRKRLCVFICLHSTCQLSAAASASVRGGSLCDVHSPSATASASSANAGTSHGNVRSPRLDVSHPPRHRISLRTLQLSQTLSCYSVRARRASAYSKRVSDIAVSGKDRRVRRGPRKWTYLAARSASPQPRIATYLSSEARDLRRGNSS